MEPDEIDLSGSGLNEEQQQAVREYMRAMALMGAATEGLVAAGLDAGEALKAIPNEDGSGSAFDALPPMLRMMLA